MYLEYEVDNFALCCFSLIDVDYSKNLSQDSSVAAIDNKFMVWISPFVNLQVY